MHVVNYAKTPDWEQEVLKLTDGKGVDYVVETGGAGTLMKSVASTRTGGLITLLGILTPNQPIPAEFVPNVLFGAKIGTLLPTLFHLPPVQRLLTRHPSPRPNGFLARRPCRICRLCRSKQDQARHCAGVWIRRHGSCL
jgi:hypothetical protein